MKKAQLRITEDGGGHRLVFEWQSEGTTQIVTSSHLNGNELDMARAMTQFGALIYERAWRRCAVDHEPPNG